MDGVAVPARRPGADPAGRRRRPAGAGCSDGRSATIERIFIDDDESGAPRRHDRRRPGPGPAARDEPAPVLLRPRGGGDRPMSGQRERRILVAGVGNAWLRDDGFGGEVARRLEGMELPAGVAVMDAGTGGLDLAYEVMRGYDALVLVDVSRQGGEPGTLYVMEPDEASIDGGIEDGDTINPHAMDPADDAALRQVGRRLAGPGGGDRLRAGATSRSSASASPSRCRPRSSGRSTWSPRPSASCRRGVARGGRVGGARAVAEQRGGEHGGQARRRPAGDAWSACASAASARWCRTRSSSTSGSSPATRCARARGWRWRSCPRRFAATDAATSGRSRSRRSAAPPCGGSDVAVASGNEFEVESIEVEEDACIAQR